VQDVAAGGLGAPESFDFDKFNAVEHRRLASESPAALRAALAEARRKTIDCVRDFSEESLDHLGRHPALGLVNLETIVTAVYGHVLLHMRDAQRVLA
jgi:hypothetical protein